MKTQNLTVSQALRTLKRLRGEIAAAQQRMQASSSWQKGKESEYKFSEVSAERDRLSKEITGLHARILRTNAATQVKDGEEDIFLCEATLRLAEIKGEIALLQGLRLQHGEVEREQVYNHRTGEYISQPPIVFESALTERERDEKVKALQDRFERLNDAVEKVNHITPLLE